MVLDLVQGLVHMLVEEVVRSPVASMTAAPENQRVGCKHSESSFVPTGVHILAVGSNSCR